MVASLEVRICFFCMHNNLSGSRLDIIVAHSHAISNKNNSSGPIQEVLQVYEFEGCCTTIYNTRPEFKDLLTDATLFQMFHFYTENMPQHSIYLSN